MCRTLTLALHVSFSFAWLPVYFLQRDDSLGVIHKLDIVEGGLIKVRQFTKDFN